MTYEKALVLVSGVWVRLWVPRSFRGVGTDAIMRCLADYDDHEVDVYIKHVGVIEWTGETQEVSC